MNLGSGCCGALSSTSAIVLLSNNERIKGLCFPQWNQLGPWGDARGGK